MNKLIHFCFDNWLRPILFCAVAFVLYLLTIYLGYNRVAIVCFILFAIGFATTFGSAIYQFFNGRWKEGLFTLLILVGTIIAGIIGVSIFFIDKR